MPEAGIFRFKIDAPYTPETMPMARLAEYMAEVAIILGERSNVHFVTLEASSTVLVHKIDAEAAPKVRERVDRTRQGEGPAEAMGAVRALNRKLREDNGKATLSEESAEILTFPGRDENLQIRFAAFTQDGTLDGIVIRLGGRREVVPVHLDNGPVIYACEAHRSVAKRLGEHIFTSELRVKGTGRWLVDEAGTWQLEKFTISDFDVLDAEPLTSVVAALRGVRGSDWDRIADPWAELMDFRNGPPETH